MKPPVNILAITYWPLSNALVGTYTLPYLRIIRNQLPPGSRLWLFTLSTAADRKSGSHRQLQDSLLEEGIVSIDFLYRPFGFVMAFRFIAMILYLTALSLTRKIRYIHAWCTPGGAIGWLVSLLSRKPLVLDSFEPHAETMVETGNWKKSSVAFRTLLWLEKKQLQRAKHVICAAPGMSGYAARAYGVDRKLDLVKPACVNLEIFKLPGGPRMNLEGIDDNDIVCVYAGKFGGIYLEKETFDFFAAAARHWPGRFKVLLLTAHTEEEVAAYCANSGFDRRLLVRLFVPHSQVPQYMALADFAICPVKPIPTKKYCSPIKNGEYWALGLPVVITKNISVDSELVAAHDAGAVLDELSPAAYEAALRVLDRQLLDPGHRSRIRGLAERQRNFSIAEQVYGPIYA